MRHTCRFCSKHADMHALEGIYPCVRVMPSHIIQVQLNCSISHRVSTESISANVGPHNSA